MHNISKEADGTPNIFWTLSKNSLDGFQASNILKYFTLENIMALSWKKKYGFLHVIEDILRSFDESHIRPFLDLLMGCVVRVLQSCMSSIETAKGGGSSMESHSDVGLGLHNDDSTAVNQVLVMF